MEEVAQTAGPEQAQEGIQSAPAMSHIATEPNKAATEQSAVGSYRQASEHPYAEANSKKRQPDRDQQSQLQNRSISLASLTGGIRNLKSKREIRQLQFDKEQVMIFNKIRGAKSSLDNHNL